MKRVQFNLKTTYRHIDDAVYGDLCKNLEKLRFTDYTKYSAELVARENQFEIHDVNIGDLIDVSDWYYNKNKDITVEINNSINNYSDGDGNHAFNLEEAKKHYAGYTPIQTVNLFDLIDDKKAK